MSVLHRLLDIQAYTFSFWQGQNPVPAVKDISFHLDKGETLGLVGASGSGKSVMALSLMRLLPKGRTSGQIWFCPPNIAHPVDLVTLPDTAMSAYRGHHMGMVFQEPMSALNPVLTCGEQVAEAIRLHRGKDTPQAILTQTLDLFQQVCLDAPQRTFKSYPHELSGGQKQRVMIALALAGNPSLLIADEPTTALDSQTQTGILDLLRKLQSDLGLSMLFISHDLGLVADMCDRVAVMEAGQIVETGSASQVFEAPQHPYTKGLAACRPTLRQRWHRLPTVEDFSSPAPTLPRLLGDLEIEARRTALFAQTPLLSVRGLSVRYPDQKNDFGRVRTWLSPIQDLNLDLFPGERLGIAGASGNGKSTLGRAIARLQPIQSGSILYKGVNLADLSGEPLRPYRRAIQMVYQDPKNALNPRLTVGQALMEPLKAHRIGSDNRERRDNVISLLGTVGLSAADFDKYPHAFSGGQRQRICIARALAVRPQLLVCDEITASLDVSTQALILNLLADLGEQFELSYLFISHDMGVLNQMCDRVLTMEQGVLVEKQSMD